MIIRKYKGRPNASEQEDSTEFSLYLLERYMAGATYMGLGAEFNLAFTTIRDRIMRARKILREQ